MSTTASSDCKRQDLYHCLHIKWQHVHPRKLSETCALSAVPHRWQRLCSFCGPSSLHATNSGTVGWLPAVGCSLSARMHRWQAALLHLCKHFRYSNHDSIQSSRAKGQQHCGAEAVCKPTISVQCPLCGSSWWARHLPLLWHENSNQREQGQDIKNCKQPGWHSGLKSWAHHHNSVCRWGARLCLSCDPCNGGTGRCPFTPAYARMMQVPGTKPQASPGVAGLSHRTTWSRVRHPVLGPKKVRPLCHAAYGSKTAQASQLLIFQSSCLPSCQNSDFFKLQPYCLPLCLRVLPVPVNSWTCNHIDNFSISLLY